MLNDLMPVKHDIPYKTFKVYPVFDVHIGSAEYMKEEFESFIDYIKNTPDTYIVVGGDMLNNAIKSSVSDVYSETMMPGEAKKYAVKLLEPIKEKILCGVGGNHEFRTVKDTNIDILYDVFCQLGIEDRYRSNICFLSLNHKVDKSMANKRHIIAVTHGSGGGATLGAGINKQQKFGSTIDGVDVLISGHTHKPSAVPMAKLRYDRSSNHIKEDIMWLVTASSWVNYGGYAARKMLSPCAHCGVEVVFGYIQHSKNKIQKHSYEMYEEVRLTGGMC